MKRTFAMTAAAALLASATFADSPFMGSDDRAYPKLDAATSAAEMEAGARYDATTMTDAPMGSGLYTSEGEVIGSIEEWTQVDGQSRMVIAVNPQVGLEAEELVVLLQPSEVVRGENATFINTSFADLKLKLDNAEVSEDQETMEIFIN